MAKKNPTESELEVLNILWQHGPSSVRFVNDELNKKKEVGYTTTLKIMQLMNEKDLLTREISGKKHIYAHQIKEKATQKSLLEKFVDSTFRGSASKLVLQALGNHEASQEELDEIKAFIEKIEIKALIKKTENKKS